MYKHLFVPVDGADLTHRLMDKSIDLAVQLKAKITGFVVEPDLPLDVANPRGQMFANQMKEHERENQKHAQALLGQFEARARQAGVEFIGLSVTAYGVDEAIIHSAHEVGCDMIVIITHGRGPIGEFIFGSHSQKIVSKSKLPVLVFH